MDESAASAQCPGVVRRLWQDADVSLDTRGKVRGDLPRRRLPVLLPARMRSFRRPRLWEAVIFIGVSYLLYSLIRNGVPERESIAVRRAGSVLQVEQWMHL